VYRTPHGEMELNLPPLPLCGGRVRPPGLDFVFAHAVRHEARALGVLTKLGDERRVVEHSFSDKQVELEQMRDAVTSLTACVRRRPAPSLHWNGGVAALGRDSRFEWSFVTRAKRCVGRAGS
jgi:hypothetical protein